MTDKELAELAGLAVAMVDAFVKGGADVAVMPEGREEEVEATLLLLMFDKEALYVYHNALMAEQEKRGLRFDVLQLPREISNSLVQRIALDGFYFLSPDLLASIAISPSGLFAIRNRIWYELAVRLPGWLHNALADKLY